MSSLDGRKAPGVRYLSVIALLFAYVLLVGGFPVTSSHVAAETQHIPKIGRDVVSSALPEQDDLVIIGKATSTSPSGSLAAATGKKPTNLHHSYIVADPIVLISAIAEWLLTEATPSQSVVLGSSTDVIASPAWWLRTVVLHL